MRLADRRLRRELVWVVVIKLVLLTLLWWLFIAPQRVEVDSRKMADVVAAPDGSPLQFKENPHAN